MTNQPPPARPDGDTLREAFKPFADFMAGGSFAKIPDRQQLTLGSPMARKQPTFGDLRKLAVAIATSPARDAAEGEQPFAWTIPGDDQADCNSFIPTKVSREGEFTKPLYAAPPKPAPDAVRLQRAHLNAQELPDVLTPPAIDQLFARDDLYTARAVFARLRSFGFSFVLAAPVPPTDGALWKTVPLEPTLEMQKAGYEALKLFFPDAGSPIGHYRIYEAMLAVAPSATGAAEPDPLADLVLRFSKALLAKLKLAQANGRSGWELDDWESACQQGLLRHIEKGDPRDVAAYCAFMWHHGWICATPPVRGDREAIARIIDPLPFSKLEELDAREAFPNVRGRRGWQARANAALEIADKLVTLHVQPGAGEGEAETVLRAVWADIEFAATNAPTDDYHGDISDETVAKLSAFLFPGKTQ